MAKKGKPKKRPPGKRPQPAKRPIPAGPAPAAGVGTTPAGGAKAGAPKAGATSAPAAPPAPGKITKAERIEAARRARRRKKLQLRIAIGAAVALVVGAIAANAVSNRSDTSAFRDKVTAGTCTFDTRNDPTSDSTRGSPNNHVASPSYKVNPPAGGNHDPGAAPAGKFEQAAAPSDARIVHSLEHGYIAIWHQPGIPKKDMDIITKVFNRYEKDVLVVPRASMPAGTKLAATAWGERLLCQNAELGPLTEFVKKYRNQGPEKVPHT